MKQTNLRVEIMRFTKELQRDIRRTTGRLDTRFTGIDRDAAGETWEHDPSMSAIMGPFHVATIVLTFVIYFQLNQVNHVYFDIPRFPFKTVNWIVAKHHVHHENMHKGNYATITLFYDKLFGTLD